MVGRLDAKGQAFLLETAPALMARFSDLPVRVHRRGRRGRRTAAAPGDGGRRRFWGQARFHRAVRGHPRPLPAFDVLAHLPTDEAFGLALLEAMAAGLPTVATDIGGCREVVRDGVTGVLVRPGDTAALREAVSDLLSRPEQCRTWGDAGRFVAERDFDFARQIDRLEALYSEICRSPRPVST